MKLIALNTWGGKLLTSLLTFLKNYSDEVDIFCFQEIYNSPEKRKIARDMKSNLYQEIARVLNNHQGYFKPNLRGHDLAGKVNFELWSGLATFIKKTIKVKDTGNVWLYREGYDLLENDNKTIPRNLQFIQFFYNNQKYLVAHFHGLWYPKSKLDNEERIEQSERIKRFLNGKNVKKILCGDFNLLPTTQAMRILEEGRRNLIKEFNIGTTRNQNYKREEKHADYILVSPDVEVIDFKVIKNILSDHYPLLLEFN